MPRLPPLRDNVIRRISEIIGETSTGLTGTQIARMLAQTRIPDPGEMTKRQRVYQALGDVQRRDGAANAVIQFINAVMDPVRFTDAQGGRFESWQAELNEVLAFAGLEIGDDGHVRPRGSRAETLSQARVRANRFREQLRDRNVHPAVLTACEDEIEYENYFHSVFEAAKSLAERLRQMTGLKDDGVALINAAVGRGSGLPLVAFNRLEDRTDESEHDGIVEIMRGVFRAFRNTTGHRPKVVWHIDEQDALDMMSTTSLLQRRLDEAVVVPIDVRRAAAAVTDA
jgi:uncharacterized protein (TIGR02391 family)